MTQSTTLQVPAAFYRGYELGNGVNDWAALPGGTPQFIPRQTLYGNKATMQVVGSNTFTRITVDAFSFGEHSTPKEFHDAWAKLMDNIWVTDPSPFTGQNRNLVFIEDRNLTNLSITGPFASAQTDFTFGDIGEISVGDIMFIYNYTQTEDRSSDVMLVTEINASVATMENIIVGSTGLVNGYPAGEWKAWKAEAAWRDAAFEAPPELGPAEEGSRGNFRKSIPMSFITNQDRFPIV